MKRVFFVFIIITAVLTAALLYFPNAFFAEESSITWNLSRYIILAAFASGVITMLIFGYIERAKVTPYFLKLKKYGPLLYQLVRRDFLTKYKRSVLGVLWSLLNPLFTMLVMTAVFSYVFRFDIENFPVYLLSGQIIFILFSESTNMAMFSVLGAAAFIKKVSVPKYIFPVSKCLSSLINFAFSFIALLLVMVITRARFHLTMLYIPVVLVYAFMFSTGISLLLSAAVVFFRDINYLYGIILTALTYFTPLFYPIEIIPDHIRWIISLNPLYHIVECFRTCAIYGGIPSLWQNTVCALLALVSLGAGLAAFYRKQDDFILYI